MYQEAITGACPCGGQLYTECCGPLHRGQPAASAEQLMRSRYCAYCLGLIDYLVATTLPAQQAQLDVAAMVRWSQESTWLGLQVKEVTEHGRDQAQVTFTASWRDPDGSQHQHRECSDFARKEERWYFIDPNHQTAVGRNAPCPCGSGRKYKRCCAT